ncbi:MAG: AAA family ATPase [Firmicutes bacterium]|nr:AAA family ATPase [Bacillota bacterium]
MGSVILLASGKGGCGKTTMAVNLGHILASQGFKTLLLDLNIGLRNLDLYMGLQDQVLFDLGDYLTGTCRLSKALVQDDKQENLSLLSAPQLRGIKGLTPTHIKVLCEHLKKIFDYIIIDSPTGISSELANAAAGADIALIILTQDFEALRNAETVDKKLEALGIRERYYAVNKIYPQLLENEALPGLEHIAQTMKSPLAGLIAYDLNIHIGNNMGLPVVKSGTTTITKAFEDIADRLTK